MRRCTRKCRGMPAEVAVVGVADLGSVGSETRTRARSLAMAAAAAGNSKTNPPAPTSNTIRNAGVGEFIKCRDNSQTCSHWQSQRLRFFIGASTKNFRPISSDSGVASCVDEDNFSSGGFGKDYDDAATSATLSVSCRSKNGPCSAQQRQLQLQVQDLLSFPDPEEEEENDDEIVNETKAMLSSSNCRKRRETTPLCEFEVESGLAMDPKAIRASPETIDSYHHRSTIKKLPSESEIEEFFSVAEKDTQKRFAEKYNFDIVKDVPLDGRYQWVPVKP